jgi:diguanylate cyclase (GGDEF)-like protein
MTPLRALVVDDNQAIRLFLKLTLEHAGFIVTEAADCEEGFRLAVESPPDVLVLDVQLPDGTGYDLCRRMRQSHALRNKPILMLTAQAATENELEGLKSGADDYLTKPVDPARLIARVAAAIQRNARELESNPLTRLPGNTAILRELEGLLQAKENFAVIYGDLNNFKSFNDRYGFLRGDGVIRLAADCFVSAVQAAGGKPSFTGHIGGDDFIAVVPLHAAEDVCAAIIARFDKEAPALYDEQDRVNGYIAGKTRQGQDVRYPVVGIALVIVRSSDRPFAHSGEISTLATELKTLAKSFGKSVFVIDRRKSSPRPPAT